MSWEKVKLGDIADFSNGINFGKDYYGKGIKLIGVSNFGDRFFPEYESLDEVKEEVVRKNDFLKSGDIVFVRSNGNKALVGRCMLIDCPVAPVTYSGFCIRARLKDTTKHYPTFWTYHFKNISFRRVMSGTAVGTNIQNLSQGRLSTYEAIVPDFHSQLRIADILSDYDTLIENNQKQIKLLEEAAQRLYKEWFVDLHFPGCEDVKIIDGLPEGWTSGVLEDVAINSGKKEKKEKRNNYNYYLPIDCIPKKSLGYVQVNDVSLAKSSLIGFQKRDIIFGAMRPYFHKVVVARDKGLTRSTCFVLNAKEPSYWSYIAMLLFAKDTVDYATQISVGTTMPYVRWKDMKNMPVIIPDKDIAENFNKQIQPIIGIIASLSEQIILLQQARDRLLPKLMSGEIEV